MNTQSLFNFADGTVDSALLGKDEMNFAEHPIALLTDKVPKGQRTIKFEDQIYDEKRKRLVTRRRLIEGSEEYGLPTATDDLVVLALIQLTKQKGNFTRRQIEFTRLELIKLLGWNDEGHSYDRIKLSLLRIKAVNYFYDNAWWDSRQKAWTTKAFSIIDNVEINDSRTGSEQSGLVASRIVWNEIVFDSFQAGFLRNIDFQVCMGFKHPTALRMYRFLGKRFYFQSDWVINLKQFAHEHLALGSNYEGGAAIARKLKPAIAELEAIGFLEPLAEAERFLKKGREWSIRFAQKRDDPILPAPPEPGPGNVAPAFDLTLALTARGVSRKSAAQLIQNHPAASIAGQIDAFDWLKARNDKRIGRSPAGYLVKSIVDDYSTPEGFTSLAELGRQAEAQRLKAQDEANVRRRKQVQDANERALADRVAQHRQSLSKEELAQLEAAAIAGTTEETRQSLAAPAMQRFRKTLLLRLIDEHLARLLEHS